MSKPPQSFTSRLVRHLTDATENLAGLETLIGDHPSHKGPVPALVEQLTETLLDAIGRLEDSLAVAQRCVKSGTVESVCAALPTIYHGVHRAIFESLVKLAAPSTAAELSRIAQIRRGEWEDWVGVVQPALADCVSVLERTHAVIGECWDDLSSRSSGGAPGVHQIVNICHRDASLSPVNLEPQSSKS